MNVDYTGSNEFGAVSRQEIKAFAEQKSMQLPESYSNYLAAHNGGMPKFRIFRLAYEHTQFFRLDELFSLNCGPDYKCLNKNWSLAESWDLEQYTAHLRRHIAIGDANGAAVLLELETGKILIYDPDHEELGSEGNITDQFELVSSSFDEFISMMISDEEAEALEEQ